MTINNERKNEIYTEVKDFDKMTFEEKIEYLKRDIAYLKMVHELGKVRTSTHNSNIIIKNCR